VTAFDAEVYRRAFESVAVPAVLIEPDFRIRDANEAALSFTGYDRDDLVGRDASVLSAEVDLAGEIGDALLAGGVWEGDFDVRTADGRTIHGQGSAAPVDVDGEVRAFVAAWVDARQKRQYENAAEVLNRLLRHDLKNDLNLVYGYIQQARSRTDDEEALAHLDDARGVLSQILDKSERARDLRRLLERAYEESTHPVRLDRAVEEAVSVVRAEFDDARVRVRDVPAVRVRADDMLVTVLEGLLENGIVHNEGSSPRVAVEVSCREETAVVAIADDGPGVPEQRADVVFGRGQTDALNHGRGLSLFFADSVVKSYDGGIRFESHDPGAYLPRRDDASDGGSSGAADASTDEADAGTVFKVELTRV
jgi:PAS domain S-box-containing protein